MSFLLWLAWTIALVPVVGDVPASVGTANDPESGQDPQKIRMEILVALVHRTAMRSRDIHFPEAKNADQPTVAALKDRQQFMTFLRELQQEELGRIRAETVVVTVSGHAASLASHPGDKAKPRAVPPPRIVPSVRPDGQIHVLLDVTEWVGKKRSPGAGTVGIQVKDGQTLVLTGVVLKYVTLTSVKIPILGDIPFVGRLFTSNHYAEEEGELVVLVTPHLVGKN
jgi:type II secretory pathway component HofQ